MQSLVAKLSEVQAVSNLRADYQKTLLLLAALKSGEVTLEQFEIVETGWKLVEPKEEASKP